MNVFPPIIILGYSEAGMLLRKLDRPSIGAILAIHGHREYPVDTAGIPRTLVLQFDDIDPPDEADPLDVARFSVRQREMAALGVTLSPPTEEHARAIIEFARDIRGVSGALLCQCQAGISRSPAAALLCLATWFGPGRERDCVEHIQRLRPAAQPHRGLIALGDGVLKRDGDLLGALDAIQ